MILFMNICLYMFLDVNITGEKTIFSFDNSLLEMIRNLLDSKCTFTKVDGF